MPSPEARGACHPQRWDPGHHSVQENPSSPRGEETPRDMPSSSSCGEAALQAEASPDSHPPRVPSPRPAAAHSAPESAIPAHSRVLIKSTFRARTATRTWPQRCTDLLSSKPSFGESLKPEPRLSHCPHRERAQGRLSSAPCSPHPCLRPPETLRTACSTPASARPANARCPTELRGDSMTWSCCHFCALDLPEQCPSVLAHVLCSLCSAPLSSFPCPR